ncbi:MAG: hypothetical protein AAGD96_22565, partial [Chloroflexota bacterium]
IQTRLAVEELPQLPDQLAVLLRSELTRLNNRFPLTPEEKDWIEQHLQNLLRPIIYKIIDIRLKEPSSQFSDDQLDDLIGSTAEIGWQEIDKDGVNIKPIQTILGTSAFLFEAEGSKIYSQISPNFEFSFFHNFMHRFSQKLQPS